MKFPKVVAAVAAMEKCQWRIGDALLDEIPMSESSVTNDAYAELEDCAEELEKQGYTLSAGTLRNYRRVANAFPPARRRAHVSWSIHAEASNPEMLDAITQIAGRKTLGVIAVRETKAVVHQHQARQYREEQRQAGVEPKKPPKFLPKPTIRQEHVGGLRLMAEVITHMNKLLDARDVIEDATSFVREHLTKLDKEETELFTDTAFDIAKLGHKLADAAQRLVDRRKKHLSVVGE
jgi:hypothetical protein